MTSAAATTAEIQAQMASNDYRRDLGNGLVVRWSAPEDVERVAALYAQVFRPSAGAPPAWIVPLWTRDMFSGSHPHIGPRDFAIVEDTRSGAVVASTCLLGYTCFYEGIPIRFGQPEVVASLPEYRHQGLIRAIFALIHAKSAQRGDLMQGITGIEYYYRQFGYEYAAPLLDEGLTVYFPAIPALKPGTVELYTLREATLDDVPVLSQLWEQTYRGTALWTEIEPDYWRWAMIGTNPDALQRWRVYMIDQTTTNSTDQEHDHVGGGEPAHQVVGALVLASGRWGAAVGVNLLMVGRGVPLVRLMPSVLRSVQGLAQTVRAIRPETPPAAGAIQFRWSGSELRDALGDIPCVEASYPYAWYLRVADLPGFLRHVAPVLERRLAESAQSGYTGELTLDFYRGGLRLAFEQGRLTAVEDWQRPAWGESNAGFPPLVFLQALFGHRSLDELRRIYPDVQAKGDAVALLDALFPKRSSLLIPLD